MLRPNLSTNFGQFILISITFLFLAACQFGVPEQKHKQWSYTDIRAFSTGLSENSEDQIIAAYTRELGTDLQIRLDLLDISSSIESDIYIALDTEPGGTTALPIKGISQMPWDTLITIPSDGPPIAQIPNSISPFNIEFIRREDVTPRVHYDNQNDYVTINLNRFVFPKYTRIFNAQVFLTSENGKNIIDDIGPFRFDARIHNRLPILIAFWNVFPAYTPAQALRRWDGAHTGPLGERHGLNMLLTTIKDHNVPVTLLDLKSPTSLSALDYLGHLQTIKQLEAEKLLILPDYLPSIGSNNYLYHCFNNETIIDYALSNTIQITQQFNLPSSKLLFAPNMLPCTPERYQSIFTLIEGDLEPKSHRWKSSIFLPIKDMNNVDQATRDGLSLNIRKKLINGIVQNYNHEIYQILGGNLSESTWGDPESVSATIGYIAEHPWMKPMNIDDIMAMRKMRMDSTSEFIDSNDPSSPQMNHSIEFTQILNSNIDIFNNQFFKTTWESFISLFLPLPPESDKLRELRKNYYFQIEHLFNASRWAEEPFSLNDCNIDSDNDGQFECVLASKNYYAVFEKAGARLVFLFVRTIKEGEIMPEIHQVIGPTSQFLVGIDDPITWNLEAGEASDSNGIHGAFSDSIHKWDLYRSSLVSPEKIIFSSNDRTSTKSFKFEDNHITIEYTNVPPMTIQIPIVLDPWVRFSSDWGNLYWENQISDGWIWGLSDDIEVKITSNGTVKIKPFISSKHTLQERENPNLGYPPGHFIPFPIAVIEIEPKANSDPLSIKLDYR
jgi:hypothetical protein